MNSNLRTKIYAGFVIASVLIGLISFFYYKSTADFIRSSEAVQHTTLNLNQLERVLSLLKDAETGERGFIITQQDQFLEPYQAAIAGLGKQRAQLKRLTAGDPFYTERQVHLDSLINTHIAFLDNNIRLIKQGRIREVTQIVVSGQGKRLLDAIRYAIAQMQKHEEQRLNGLQLEEKKDVSVNYLVNYIGIALTVVLFAIGYWVITSDLSRREKLEQALKDKNEQLATLNEELESALEEATAANDKIVEYSHLLEEKNHTLQDLNQELEAFSYTISHDLQSPLHTIAGYSGLLTQAPVVAKDAETLRQVGIIEKNALKMDALINDLLKFARLGKTAIRKTPTDMSAIVSQVISSIQENKDLKRYTFELGMLPEVSADKQLIQQVWANLITNAVKFSSRIASPVIEIGSENTGEKTIFYVKDNGIGFDQAHEDLFGVFKRLHTAESFEGSGIGLAIVQRIVKNHGGEVWAESNPGKGASFYFTLPG